jgi:nucleoside phosphorylase/CheY-like chemotaxis protein
MLKILIVEDTPTKLRHIVKALQAVPECRMENIDQTGYANEAKRKLKETQYDLLILDIAIPERPDRAPSPEGGIGLLQEILDRDHQYLRPKHIVGLTAFPNILAKVARKFEEDLWMVILYDASSSHWADQLRRKVEYILLVERSRPVEDFASHLGIVTALHAPELKAVLDTVHWSWQKFQIKSDASTYFKGSFLRDGETREVVAVSAPRMGIAAASVSSMKLIAAFRPRYLAMVGIAAGVKGQCNLGDVLVADPCWDWGSGKVVGNGHFHQAPHQIGVESFVRSRLMLLEQDAPELDAIRRGWNGFEVQQVLRMHVGPMASGSAVLADENAVSKILRQHRKLVGIDMETYGVYSAAQESSLPQPKAFSIKGASDFADKKKGDAYRGYAAYTSAQALRVFAERYL